MTDLCMTDICRLPWSGYILQRPAVN